MKGANRLPGSTLTVIIRNDGPVIHCGDSPSYRSVQIQLTDAQRRQLALGWAGRSAGHDHWEAVSQCFIEPETP